jgi:hypothetical protein
VERARISEVLALTPAAIDIESGIAKYRNSEAPQARHRPASTLSSESASRTQSRV